VKPSAQLAPTAQLPPLGPTYNLSNARAVGEAASAASKQVADRMHARPR
jgi:hypothetical protein